MNPHPHSSTNETEQEEKKQLLSVILYVEKKLKRVTGEKGGIIGNFWFQV